MLSPSFSLTMAFFQRAVVPSVRPRTTALRRTCIVRTLVTVTLNSCPSAAAICGLEASGCTSNAYSPRSWKAADDFSVTSGRTATWWSAGILLPLLLGGGLLRRLLGRRLRRLGRLGRPGGLRRL